MFNIGYTNYDLDILNNIILTRCITYYHRYVNYVIFWPASNYETF